MTHLLLLVGCHASVEPTLVPAALRPVAEVRWQTETAVRGWIEYQYGERPEMRTPMETVARTEHRFWLAGVPPGAQVSWRAVWGDRWSERTAWQQWDVASFEVPEGAPKVLESGNNPDPGYVIVAEKSPTFWIVDGAGDVVWWWSLPEGRITARVRPVGERLWFSTSLADQDIAFLGAVNLDGTEDFEEPLAHHHDLLVLRDDEDVERQVYLRRVSGPGPDGEPWAGDEVIERIDGVERVVWSTFDDVSFELHGPNTYPQGLDWTHCNGLFWEPGEQAYWVSSRHQEALFVVDREGHLLRVIGGPQSTLQAQGEGFGRIHVPVIEEDRLYVFDNTATASHRARAEVYRLDLVAETYTLIDAHERPKLNPDNHGNVSPTSTGGLMVAFGASGVLDLVSAEDEVTLSLETDGLLYPDYLPSLSVPIE